MPAPDVVGSVVQEVLRARDFSVSVSVILRLAPLGPVMAAGGLGVSCFLFNTWQKKGAFLFYIEQGSLAPHCLSHTARLGMD